MSDKVQLRVAEMRDHRNSIWWVAIACIAVAMDNPRWFDLLASVWAVFGLAMAALVQWWVIKCLRLHRRLKERDG